MVQDEWKCVHVRVTLYVLVDMFECSSPFLPPHLLLPSIARVVNVKTEINDRSAAKSNQTRWIFSLQTLPYSLVIQYRVYY